MNKSRVANMDKMNATILTTEGIATTANKSKTPSPTHNQVSPTTLHPLVQLTKEGFASSLDSDSSSLPDTTNNTWSCSTAATAIQQANNLSSNSLQLELNSQLSSLTHTPERTPNAERQRNQSTPNASNKPQQDQGDSSTTPDDSQDLDYYPMTTAITRELRLEAENLDRQLFGDLISMKDYDEDKKDSTSSEIEYEKLGKDSLDLVEDLKENEIITCPEVSELLMRRRRRDKTLTAKMEENLLNGQMDSNLNIHDGDYETEATQMKATVVEALKLNPFLDESLVKDDLLSITQKTSSNVNISTSSSLYNLPTNTTSLPEVLVPISSTDTPDTAAIDEMATTAAEEEVTFSSKAAQYPSNSSNTSTSTPRLPPPSEFGGGNPFLMFLCLTLLLQHRNTIMKSNMDYNEIAMHFDKMVRKHDVTRVLNQARRMYIDYLKNQTTYNPQQKQEQQQQPSNSGNNQQQAQSTSDVNKNATASTSQTQKHSKNNYNTSSTATSSNTSPSYYNNKST